MEKDEEDVLICEAYRIATTTADETRNCPTPLADHLIDNMALDENQNVMVTVKMNTKGGTEEDHMITLNKLMTSRS